MSSDKTDPTASDFPGTPAPDARLDTCGLICPLPVLKLRKRLQALAPGQVIEVLADDPVAVIDIPHFCEEAGHEQVSVEMRDAVQVHLIRKG